MRSIILSALLALPLASVPLRADPASELVVALAAPRAGAIAAAAQRARFTERLSALGLASRGALADGLALTRAPAPGGRPNPFGRPR